TARTAEAGLGNALEHEVERTDAEDAEQGERAAPCPVGHQEPRAFSGLQVHVEILPEQRVVRLHAMRPRRDLARGLLPEQQCAQSFAVDADHDLPIAYVVNVLARDRHAGGRGFRSHFSECNAWVGWKNLPT